LIVISNSSPIILLARIGRLDLLRDLFGAVIIPPAVRLEILGAGGDRPGAAELAEAAWVRVQAVADQEMIQSLLGELGSGEAEVIALANESQEPVIALLDDAAGRRHARERGVPVLGTAGILIRSKERGLIPLVRPHLDEIRVAGLYLSDALYDRLLDSVGEDRDSFPADQT
jgi:uncharacterized protein